MRLAAWNLNNRVGKVRFRLEAAAAACALDADVLVFTEYFPQDHHQRFLDDLAAAGWMHTLLSRDTGERANRVLIASRLHLEQDDLELPDFDLQFPANILAARLPAVGIRLLGLRVPWYGNSDPQKLLRCWEWIEATAATLRNTPAVIVGDFNVRLSSAAGRGGDHFRRMMQNGWQRAEPSAGHSYFGRGGVRSEIDHALSTVGCEMQDAEYIMRARTFELAGSSSAISDHAALRVNIAVREGAA
jgi:endonuclease/exonuclease/phosphatase family metal-dependent hydrolase